MLTLDANSPDETPPLSGDDSPSPAAEADRRPHAIVIGSGFGGLAAAIRLGVRGYRVTVLEKLDAPGGRAYVYRQDGYTFDAGPTIVTAPFLFEELWQLCGKQLADDVELRPVTPFYRIRFDNGEHFDYTGDPEQMRAEVARFSPADVAGYERFLERSEAIFEKGFVELGHVPFGSFTDMLKIAPDLIRLESWRSVYGLVARYIEDERLRHIFSYHPLLVGGNPFAASAIYCLICFLERRWGVHYAMGGTGRLVTGMVGLIEGQGGSLRLKPGVAEILVENGKANGVRLESGETLPADIVVSNADSATTYAQPDQARASPPLDRQEARPHPLLDEPLRLVFRHRIAASRTCRTTPSSSAPATASCFTTSSRRRSWPTISASTCIARPRRTRRMAPEGCDAFYVLTPVPHNDSGIDWSVMAETLRQRIEQHLEATMLPGLKDAVVTSTMLTPDDFEHRLSSYKGAAFGLEPVLTQSAWFRPHNKSEDIEGLYLVGAGTHPGAGLPGVLSSARVLDTVVPHGDDVAQQKEAGRG
jgi:phytoene desaturase